MKRNIYETKHPGVSVDDDAETERPTDPTEGRPIGAILVTTFLALMILISWFGMYFLDFLRS